MINSVGGFFAGLLHVVLAAVLGVGALVAGIMTAERSNKNWLGWLVGVTAFALAVVAFGPSLDALQRVSCKSSDDFSACMNDDQ